jgi:hypothetical protein
MVPNNTTLQDWLKAHDALMNAERELSDAAVAFASGKISHRELDDARANVVMLRELCDAVFRKAVDNLGNLP